MSAPSNQKAFTLVELLVVISIIAILSVIGITIFSSAQKAARDAKRKEDLKALLNALEQYKVVNGRYPIANGVLGCADPTLDQLTAALVPTYINSIPRDPSENCNWVSPGRFYKYYSYDNPSGCVGNSGSKFELAASLENAASGNGDFTACFNPANNIFLKVNGGFGFRNQQ